MVLLTLVSVMAIIERKNVSSKVDVTFVPSRKTVPNMEFIKRMNVRSWTGTVQGGVVAVCLRCWTEAASGEDLY